MNSPNRKLPGKRGKYNGSRSGVRQTWSRVTHSLSNLLGFRIETSLVKGVGSIPEVQNLIDFLDGNQQQQRTLAKAHAISAQGFVQQAQSMITER